MSNPLVFQFISDLSTVPVPTELNNPFGKDIPEIARIASAEFQEFIKKEESKWEYDFATQRGKMFGVLVVKSKKNELGFLGTMSGTFPGNKTCNKFAPSVFDVATDDYFINKGMTELTNLGKAIKNSTNRLEIKALKECRKNKSYLLQRKLFENYFFSTSKGVEKRVKQIFVESLAGNPPAAAGECAAPKLLQCAFNYELTPIAIAEFWWGNISKNKERKQLDFYPACQDKCKPILGYMLENNELFSLP